LGGVIFDAVRAGRPVGHGEIGGGRAQRVDVDGDVHQMRVGALESQLVVERSGSGSDRRGDQEKDSSKHRNMNQAAQSKHEPSKESKQELPGIVRRLEL